jgi:hypothetical protein
MNSPFLSLGDAARINSLEAGIHELLSEAVPIAAPPPERKTGPNGSLVLFHLRGIYFHERPVS